MFQFLKILWLPVVLFVVNSTALAKYLYKTYIWFDIPMHVLGGVAIALMFTTFHAQMKFGWWKNIPWLWQILFTVCFVMFFGAAWEWYEFLSDIFLGTHDQPSLADTMHDFLFDFIGALLFCFAARFSSSNRK